MVHPRLAAAAFSAALLVSAAARAAPYSAEYVFGDSLSDNGNLAEVYYNHNLPNPPSYHDSFTNGPVAAQVLASQLGLTLTPSLWVTGFRDTFSLFGGSSYTPGTNYAVAGATAAAQAVGGPPSINLPQQVAAFSAVTSGHADPNALYLLMIGGNDVRNAALYGTGTAAIAAGVATEVAAVQTLANEGARKFLVVNVPDVGIIPEFAQGNPTLAPAATQYTQSYNAALAAGLAGLSLPSGADLSQFDLYDFNADIRAHASVYGLTDLSDPCYTATPLSAATSAACGPNAVNIASLTYWDAIHPTATVQALWGQGMAQALDVPEPASAMLLPLGLVGAVALARRRRAA